MNAPPRWAAPVLIVAAAYNLLWGAAAILWPLETLRLCGFFEPPRYPELWQCIGMIVGVYGVGYAIAARDPWRHWPIILVGLLGKVFGPIGMANAILSGTLPVSAARTILTNDLIWWLPFGWLLVGAWRAVRSSAPADQSSFE
ncbi:MAG: hypothetical protein KDA75_06465 [Planctomycetaceae bacterium]|nr:hypothetical protein [Planctomycetaceae bacterium]